MERDVLTDRHVREGEEQGGGTDYTPMKINFGCSGCPVTNHAADKRHDRSRGFSKKG